MMFKKINDLYALRKWALLFFVVVFIFWIKQDINQRNIKTFDEFTTVYDFDSIYQYTDFLIDERRNDFLNFFAAKANQK